VLVALATDNVTLLDSKAGSPENGDPDGAPISLELENDGAPPLQKPLNAAIDPETSLVPLMELSRVQELLAKFSAMQAVSEEQRSSQPRRLDVADSDWRLVRASYVSIEPENAMPHVRV